MEILGSSVRNKAAWASRASVWSLRSPCYSLWIDFIKTACLYGKPCVRLNSLSRLQLGIRGNSGRWLRELGNVGVPHLIQ